MVMSIAMLWTFLAAIPRLQKMLEKITEDMLKSSKEQGDAYRNSIKELFEEEEGSYV